MVVSGAKDYILCNFIYLFTQDRQKSIIKDMWMRVYTVSVVSITNNESSASDVLQCMDDDVMNFLTNGGSQFFDKAGMLAFLTLCVHMKFQKTFPFTISTNYKRLQL